MDALPDDWYAIPDDLSIPKFLLRRLETPEQAAARREGDRELKGRLATAPGQKEAKPRTKFDKAGRSLPRNLGPDSLAVLAIENGRVKDKEKKADAEKKERFRVLAVEKKAQATVKRRAKAAAKAARAVT
jgi:hypothetical protein